MTEPQTEQRDELQELFGRYRRACPDIEPGPDFLAGIWKRIEGRESFWSVFGSVSRPLAAASAAACLLMSLLAQMGALRSANVLSYPDALAAAPGAEASLFPGN